MPRPLCLAADNLAFRVPNRRSGRLSLLEKLEDSAAYEQMLVGTAGQRRLRVAACYLMLNQWILPFCPRHVGMVSKALPGIRVTPTHSWHAHRHISGRGQHIECSKSFPVETNQPFLMVARSVKRNAARPTGRPCRRERPRSV